MKIVDPELLETFRQAGRCELCGRPGSDPHHVLARGLGAGGQLDVRENLVTLCRRCHDLRHLEARPSFAVLLLVVAQREGLTLAEIERRLCELRRARR